jgi:hypothetical protein
LNRLSEMIIHRLKCERDICDEYETDCDIDFMFTESIEFQVFKDKYKIDRIKMFTQWGEVRLQLSDGTLLYESIRIPRHLYCALYKFILISQKRGVLQSWSFEEVVRDEYNSNYKCE